MIIYKYIKIVLFSLLMVPFCLNASVAARLPLEPQLKKTPAEREDKLKPGIINGIQEAISPSVLEEDEDWNATPEKPTPPIARDFKEMSSSIKQAMEKQNFKLGDHPYSLQGLPIAYTSKTTGFNLGTRISLADLKTEDPYTFLFSFQFWQTDRGAKNHQISLDVPELFSKHWRLKLTYTYPEVIDNNYFGLGNKSVYNQDFITPGNPNFISRNYYQYIFVYPRFTIDLSYKFFRERLSLYGGIGIDKGTIHPINKDSTSKIYTEQPYGYNGGKTNYIKIGLKFDSRDYPMNPTKGFVVAATYTDHVKFMGSDFNYVNIDLTYMGFFAFLNYFVLSHRVMIDQALGNNLPFFALAEFNSYNNYQGLGGEDTLRGAPTFRYIDNLKFINQLELRTRFYNGVVFGQHMELFLVPYWDFGKVWDRYKKINFEDLHHTVGNEFRFTWNTTFIASFTMGFSKDNFATYLSFGESFD